MYRIPFNTPFVPQTSIDHVVKALQGRKFCGAGPYSTRCAEALQDLLGSHRVLLTPSCTDALEMMAVLAEITPGDEVILPSYTFVSTANAFLMQGAHLVFVDIRPDTMNLDETLVEEAITQKTKAIVPVHYAGVGCEMEQLQKIATAHNLLLLEDAAQGMAAHYHSTPLGTMGELGAFSFHETKNYHCGEGGALLVNVERLVERAEIVYEKGTNRSRFFRGEIDKYTWVDKGSSYLMPELSAAFLLGQIELLQEINQHRLALWNTYFQGLTPLAERNLLLLPHTPQGVQHNAHMFYIKLSGPRQRTALMAHLKDHGIHTVFHYVPLHSSKAGLRYGRFHGEDRYTTKESERLLRLPLYYKLSVEEVHLVVHAITTFFTTSSRTAQPDRY